MNVAECKIKTLQVMREHSNNGEITNVSDNKDYLISMPNFFNTIQKEIAKIRFIRREFQFSKFPSINLLGIDFGYLPQRKSTEDLEFIATGARAYHVAPDNAATIKIQERINGTWTDKTVIENTAKNKFTAHKGLINLTDANNDVRILCTGPYSYSVKQIALFADNFAAQEDVPDYDSYVEIDLPDNFFKFDRIFATTEWKGYHEFTNYKFTPSKKLRIPYMEQGEFIVHYNAMPDEIPYSETDINIADSYEFQIEEDSQELIPLKAAYDCLRDEPKLNLEGLLSEYYIALNNLTDDDGQYAEEIQSTFSMTGNDGWW